jgi:hypothetical protein
MNVGRRARQFTRAVDELLARATAERIERSAVGTYCNGVRRVRIADPDEDAIAFAEPPAGLFAQ